MKESLINGDRAIVANDQSAKVTEPSQGAFHFPAPPVAPQRSPSCWRGLLRFQRCGAINSIPRVANRSRSGSLS
jgi:hypothetical protein